MRLKIFVAFCAILHLQIFLVILVANKRKAAYNVKALMDNWILKGVKNLVNEHATVSVESSTQVKVKVSYALLTDYDALLYNGDIKADYPKVLGRTAVGIVTEVGENCYGLQVGSRVYFEPTRPCGNCLRCKSGKPKDCREVSYAGKDFDGFLRDFVVCEGTEVSALPSNVDDIHALCIELVGIAENIFDKLNVTAGQRVAVIGASLSGNIIAQILAYHKIVPVVIDNNPVNLERAKKCGINYAFAADDDLDEHIKSATSGNLCEAAIYCTSSRLPLSIAPRVVADGKSVVLSALSSNVLPIDAREILKKNITLFGVSNAYGYTDTAINLLVNHAVNIDMFEKEILNELRPAELLDNSAQFVSGPRHGKMSILKLIL